MHQALIPSEARTGQGLPGGYIPPGPSRQTWPRAFNGPGARQGRRLQPPDPFPAAPANALKTAITGCRPWAGGPGWFTTRGRLASCPLHAQCSQRVQLLFGEFVAALFLVGVPDADLGLGPVGQGHHCLARRLTAFPLHPLCEGCQAALERLLRFARPLRRGLPPGQETAPQRAARPAWTAVPAARSTAAPRCSAAFAAAAIVRCRRRRRARRAAMSGRHAVGVDEVGEDAVVALPVQWPGAVPVRVDRRQLLRALAPPAPGPSRGRPSGGGWPCAARRAPSPRPRPRPRPDGARGARWPAGRSGARRAWSPRLPRPVPRPSRPPGRPAAPCAAAPVPRPAVPSAAGAPTAPAGSPW